MPKINAFSRDNNNNTIGFIDLLNSRVDQSLLTTSTPTFNGINLTNDMIIGGNLTVNGDTTIISSTVVEIEDNIILLNAEETGAGISLNLAGVEVGRGSLPNFQSVYEESTGLYKIGEIGTLQAVATREDLPLDKGVLVYNSSLQRLDSTTTLELPITFSGAINPTSSITGTIIVTGGGGIGVTGDIYTDSRLFIKGGDYSNYIDVDNSNSMIVNHSGNFIFQQLSDSEIRIPENVYMTYGGANKRIFNTGTQFNFENSTGNINLITSNNGSVTLQQNTYLEWNSSNRIVYNGVNVVLDGSGNFTINPPIISTNTNISSSSVTGSFRLSGSIGISNNQNSSSSVSGGTFTTAGGASVSKRLYIGEQVIIADQNLSVTQVAGRGTNFRSINRTATTTSTTDITFNSIEGGTVNLSSGTINNASTFYITGSPTIIGGGSLTNSYSLWINSGISRFDGLINSINTTSSSSSTSGSILVAGGISLSSGSDAISSINGGTFTTAGGLSVAKKAFIGNQLLTGELPVTIEQVSAQGANFRSLNRIINTDSDLDLTINSFEGSVINTSQTIENCSTIYITGGPTVSGGGTINNSYAIWVQSGSTRLDGMILVGDTTPTISPTTGAIKLEGGVGINNDTDAINEDNGGSVTTSGGIAIKKKLFVGTQITSNAGTGNNYFRLFNTGLNRFSIDLTGTETGSNSGSDFIISRYDDSGVFLSNDLIINRSTGQVSILATTNSTSSGTGSFILPGSIGITNTTNATSSSSGGTFTTAGGVGIAKDLYVGSNSFVTGTFDVDGLCTLDQTTIDTTDGIFNVSGTNGINIIVDNTSTIRTTTGSLILDADVASVTIDGNAGVTIDANSGISIDANAASNFSTTTGAITISAIGLNLQGNSGEIDLTTTGIIDINSGNGGITLDTTDTTQGIKIGTATGFVPITIGHTSSEVIVSDNLTIGGNLTVLGTTTSIDSSVTTITDNALVVNALPAGLSDGGYMIRRYQTPNNINSGQVVTDTPFETGTFQAGSITPDTLVLSLSASSIDDFYSGMWIVITSGPGISQVRRIKEYIGSTKIATIYVTSDNSGSFQDGLNLSVAPDNGDTYNIYDCTFITMYHSELNKEIRFSCIPIDISSGTFPEPGSYVPIHVGGITIENNLLSNGNFLVNGNILIDNTDTQALLVRKNGDTGDVFTVDTVNGDILIANPVNTIGQNISLLFQQLDTVNAVQVYSQINSTIINNVAGNLRNNLEFKVQKDTAGLTTYLTLSGSTAGTSFADFSNSVDAVRILNTTSSTSSSSGSLRLSGGLSISNSTNATNITNGGSFTTAGGASIAQDLYVGGNMFVTGNIQAGLSIPSITISNNVNITGSVTSIGSKLISNGNERILSTTFRFTPTAPNILTSFEITIPGVVSFTNVYDIVITTNGYAGDIDPINLENQTAFAVVSTARAKIKLTSNSTDNHTLQIIARYNV